MAARITPDPDRGVAMPTADDQAEHEVFFHFTEDVRPEIFKARANELVRSAETVTETKARVVNAFPNSKKFLVVAQAPIVRWLMDNPEVKAQAAPTGSAMIKPVGARPSTLEPTVKQTLKPTLKPKR